METKQNNPLSFLSKRPAVILTVLLLSQAAVFYGFSRGEKTPAYRPLDEFPKTIGSWKMVQQGVMEPEVKEVLRADDYITRFYGDPGTNQLANLFVAFFKSQRYGQQPHSPKNCLPGSGWIWTVSDTISIPIPGRPQPIVVNRYIVQKGESKSLVLYWYESRDRVVASDYMAKVFVVADALRYNRTDTSLVRVWVPIVGKDEETPMRAAVSFTQSFFGPLGEFLPK
jgi:EpsI family protein